MGAQASVADEPALDARFLARAWREGVPFTLLRDQSYVADKIQELAAAGRLSAAAAAALEASEGEATASGLDEAPLDELQQAADVARVKLFARAKALDAGAGDEPGDEAAAKTPGKPAAAPADAEPSSSYLDRENAASALEGTRGNPLARESLVARTDETLRVQRAELVRSYFAQLRAHVEAGGDAPAGELEAALDELAAALPAGAAVAAPPDSAIGFPGPRGLDATGAIKCSPSSLGVFEMSSFRVQLEMLREFRATSPRMFEKGVMAIVQTVLDYAPFSLQDVKPNWPGDALLKDVHSFCHSQLRAEPNKEAPLSESGRQVLLLMLLAFGIASGRISLLLEFIEGVATLKNPSGSEGENARDDPFYSWVEVFITQLLEYRLHFGLGTLEENTLVNQIPVKAMPKDQNANSGQVAATSCSVAVDGNFLYTWNPNEGLSKVGTGLNFTVAGKVYAKSPALQFTSALYRAKPVYRALIYGIDKAQMTVTDVIQKEVCGLSFGVNRTVRDIMCSTLQAAIAQKHPKLLVGFAAAGREKFQVFDEDDILTLSVDEPLESELSILYAYYGCFYLLEEDAVATLRDHVSDALPAESGSPALGMSFSSELLSTLLASSKIPYSESTELVAIYEFGSNQIGSHSLRVEDPIIWVEKEASTLSSSSLLVCKDSLYLHLSLLPPSATHALESPDCQIKELPKLVRIDMDDLSVAEVVYVRSHPRKSIAASYISEGKFLYEIGMTANAYQVEVFDSRGGQSGKHEFVPLRSYQLAVEHISCEAIGMALSMLSNTTASKCEMPAFYTNGVTICMVFPEASENDASKPHAALKTHCALFSAQTGCNETLESAEAADRYRPVTKEASSNDTHQCFERKLPATAVCFDGRNNLIWLFNEAKNTFVSYQNTGHRICMNERSIRTDRLEMELNGTGKQTRAAWASLRVLGALYAIVESSAPRDKITQTAASPKEMQLIPFVADLEVQSIQSLLSLSKKYSSLFKMGKASRSDLYCLQACLSVLTANIENLLTLKDGPQKRAAMTLLRAGLTAPLEDILQLSSRSENIMDTDPSVSTERDEDIKALLTSVTLDLYTMSMRIVHSDVSNHLSHILKYLRGWEQGKASLTELEIMTRLLQHVSTRMSAVYNAMVTESATLEQFTKIVDFAVGVQKQRIQQVMNANSDGGTKSNNQIVADREASAALVGLVNSITQLIFASTTAKSGEAAFNVALKVYESVSDACASIIDEANVLLGDVDKHPAWPRLESALKTGFVGVLASVVLTFAAHLLRERDSLTALGEALKSIGGNTDKSGTTDQTSPPLPDSTLMTFLNQHASKLQALTKPLSRFISQIDPSEREVLSEGVSMTTISESMESEHDYANNLDVLTELCIPGAIRMVVSFDPKTRTENNYDYVTFFKDRTQSEYYGSQMYSGRDAEHNWPGVGGNPPLIIDNDKCFVMFHTDSSNTDWGFRFTATGELLEKKNSIRQHWVFFLLETVFQVLDESVRLLLDGHTFAPIGDDEISNDRYLRSDLLRSGICTDETKDAKVLQLLQDFVDPPSASAAKRLLDGLSERSYSGGPRRSFARSTSFKEIAASATNTGINCAVRAATAAILHHNMWGMDAFAYAHELRNDVSEQVLRGWTNAQKMRDWFYLGDAAEGGIHAQSTPRRRSLRLRRQPSAFKGMSEESLQILCSKVIERAKFLLELTPASFSFVTGAKRRWSLLAKYGNAIRKLHPSESPLEKWYNLLDELHAATELRSLFQYRRSSSERLKSGQVKSVTEQVLEFIQSDVDINEIRQVMALRNLRASSRSVGLHLFVDLLNDVSSARLQGVLTESLAATLKKSCFDYSAAVVSPSTVSPSGETASSSSKETVVTPRIHFDVGLLGCDEVLRQRLSEEFGRCLASFSGLLSTFASRDGNQLPSSLVIAILKACAIDYELEDSVLLHECRILTMIFGLLSTDSIGVRRAAQSLLGIILSRFVIGKASTAMKVAEERGETHGAASFQRLLFTAVGLQLDGVVSSLPPITFSTHDDESNGTAPSRYWYLPANSPGLTASALTRTRIQWDHSIMLWVYVAGNALVYALKSGDKVRRGPSWGGNTEEDTSEEQESEPEPEKGVGTVISISSPTSVLVKWANKTEEARFDPKRGIYDVVLVDEGFGGAIFFKGNKNLLKDYNEDGSGISRVTPWSHFGLFLNDNRHLSYRIACADDKECVYETNYELDTEAWAHVAVVQDHSILRIFVNGSMASQHVLDPFLVMDGNVSATESKIVQSAHPTPDTTVDQYWPVRIPGASNIRITFDPLCDVDGTTGYVRIYKDTRCDEYWGEPKYTGKYSDPERNFPGAQSNRSRRQRSSSVDGSAPFSAGIDYIEVPADNFIVYFHSESSPSSWGFRLLAAPEFLSSEANESHGAIDGRPVLNPYPFYFGEPPSRVIDAPAAKVWICEPQVANFAISESDLVAHIQDTYPTSAQAPTSVSSERILYILGLIRSCAETQFAREQIATPKNVGNLMALAFHDHLSIEVRSASLLILKELAGLMEPADLESQFASLYPQVTQPFLTYVFERLGDATNVWKQYLEDKKLRAQPSSDSSEGFLEALDLRSSAQGQASLVLSYVSLLRSLSNSDEWGRRLIILMVDAVNNFQRLCETGEDSARLHGAIGSALAVFSVLGGTYDGACLGGRVKCCVNIDGKESIESGYLIQFNLKNGAPSARVLFDCDTSHAVDVPLADIAHLDEVEHTELVRFVSHMKPFENDLARIYQTILMGKVPDPQPHELYKSKVIPKECAEILESEHPYSPEEDATYSVKFPGVNEIIIRFDKLSSIAGPSDYIQFRKHKSSDDDKEEFWGEEKYFGSGAAFPGVGDTPPLRIPSDAVEVYFHSESSSGAGSEWGFKLSASAFESVVTLPPEVAPGLLSSALMDLRARSTKSIQAILRAKETVGVAPSMFSPLLSALVPVANAPSCGRPTQALTKTQVFESKHPYANSVQEYMAVTFSGASKLTIAFDSQSRTEQGCDYVCFFKDKTLSERWGAYQYCGIDGSANWPGTGGRAPLVITNDSFTLLWCTDASNVDWGWKFTVTAEFPPLDPLQHRLDQLDCRAYAAFEVLYEKIDTQTPPLSKEFESFEKFADSAAALQTAQKQDPMRQLLGLAPPRLEDHGTAIVRDQPRYRVLNENGVSVYKEQSSESELVCELSSGKEFGAIKIENGWVQVVLPSDESIKEPGNGMDEHQPSHGWIQYRTGDSLHISRVSAFTESEELLTLGVDDLSFEPKHSNFEMDENNDDLEQLNEFSSPFTFDALKGQMNRVQSLTYDTHRAIATKASQQALLKYLCSKPIEAPAQWSDIGGPEEGILLLSRYFIEEIGREAFNNRSQILDALETRVRSMLTAVHDDAESYAVLQKCFSLIQASGEMLPRGRGALRVLESTHPYHDNMDQYWPIEIPGAKKIKIVFDRQSKTETGCDYVTFYRGISIREDVVGPDQISGRADNQNWPGFGGRAPLIIDGDSCEVYFHSDSSQNDWGFKLYAIGIFEEEAPPLYIDESELVKPADDKRGSRSVGLLSFVFWMLSVVAVTPSDQVVSRSASYRALRSPHLVQSLIKCVENMPQQVKMYGLQVITAVTRSPHFHAMPTIQMEQLRDVLIKKLQAQHLVEERVEAKSPYLQALIDCATAMDLALDSNIYTSLSKINREVSMWNTVDFKCDSDMWISQPSSSVTGVHQFRFIFTKVFGPIQFSLFADMDGTRKASPVKYVVKWSDIGELKLGMSSMQGSKDTTVTALCNRIVDGDAVTLQVDTNQQTIVYRRNNVVVATIAGSPGSGALFPWSQLPIQAECLAITFSVGLQMSGDASKSCVEYSLYEHSPMALVSNRVVPGWYNKVVDSMGMLLDFSEDRASKVVVAESVHPLVAKSDEEVTSGSVEIDGAIALEIRFDHRTKIDASDSLRLYHRDGADAQINLSGIDGSEDSVHRPSWFASDPNRPVNHLLRVGDAVVRSIDWEYGNEDGGPGGVGVVEELCSWGGHSGTGVRVKWMIDGRTSLHRYGFRGTYDVQKRQSVYIHDAPLVIPGSSMMFEFRQTPKEIGSDTVVLPLESPLGADFSGSLRLGGSSTLELPVISFGADETSQLSSSDLTIEFWLRVERPDNSHGEQSRSIEIFSVASFDEAGESLSMLVDANGHAILALTNVGLVGPSLHTDASFKPGNHAMLFDTWVHLAIVCSGSTASLYQNARLLSSSTDAALLAFLNRANSPQIRFGFATPDDKATNLPLNGNLYDVRVWDSAFKLEQLRSHVVGLESVEPFADQSSGSRPSTPGRSNQAPSVLLAGLESPRASQSSPRSPRSPSSRSMSLAIPPHMKRWVTINRNSSRDMATVRLNSVILPPGALSDSDSALPSLNQGSIVYYEAHALSNGIVCVGWIADSYRTPPNRSSVIGETPLSFGIELSTRQAHFTGTSEDLAVFTSNFSSSGTSSALNSPRGRRGSGTDSKSGKPFFNDVFCRQGDVIGCALRWDTREMTFYVNGQFVARNQLTIENAEPFGNNTFSSTLGSEELFSEASETTREFEELVDEMVSIGFSRQTSSDALVVSGAKDVPAAVDWLLTSSTDSTDSGVHSRSAAHHSVNPSQRSSIVSSRRSQIGKTKLLGPSTGFMPSASLGAQGAQGIAWNFGQRPFKYEPIFDDESGGGGNVVTVLQAIGQQAENAHLEIFDFAEDQWERIVYRHRLHDLTPRLLAWWKLDEGTGDLLEDSARREMTGKIRNTENENDEKGAGWWDTELEPPVAAKRRNEDASMISPFFLSSSSGGDFTPTAEQRKAEPSKPKQGWGYRFYVIPHFSPGSIGRRRFQSPVVRYSETTVNGLQARHDRQLVKYVNKVAQTKQLTTTQLLRATWSEIAPDAGELVRWPVLVEIATGAAPPPPPPILPPPAPNALRRTSTTGGVTEPLDAPMEPPTAPVIAISASARLELHERLAKRFKLLQEFNSAISRVLPLVRFDFTIAGVGNEAPQQLGQLLVTQRYRIFSTVKRGVWDAALARTAVSTSVATVEVTFNRPKAMRHRATRQVDSDARATLFSQAFRQLNALDAAHFRRSDNLYHVTFLGENATDAGGPYRETLAQFCEELESAQLPLLLPTSNAQHNVGAARDKWVLNPGALLISPTMGQLLEFLGKLFGAALRSKHYLALHLAAVMWKPLVGERVTLEDLASVDSMIVNSMRQMRSIDALGVTEEMFEDIVMEVFTTLSTDNRVVELLPRGASRAVTFSSRGEYADLVEQYRLHEGDAAVAYMRRGLAKVVPAKLLGLFTSSELETMICGAPEIDVDLLQRCTEYSGCNSTDAHVDWFWRVLRDFSQEERSAFLRFVWGRARLPAHEKEFPQLFKLQSFSVPSSSASSQRRRGIDDYLPVSHTCFFALELPAYTSEGVLREKLRYAIYNCQEIDGDGDSVAANQLGWEE